MTEHVPDQKRCLRLDELGMPQETEFVWRYLLKNKACNHYSWYVVKSTFFRLPHKENEIAAPLATEMLKWLPADILVNGRGTLFIVKHDGSYTVGYGTVKAHEEAELVNALADLLIWCVEQGHVRFEEHKP